MKRYSYSTRDRYYNHLTSAGRLSPMIRRIVVPGQKINDLDLTINMQTPEMTSIVMNEGLLTHYAFYVPFRLIWDDWTTFVTNPDTPPAVPRYGSNPDGLFYDILNNQNALYRRAYKLCFNQFFGDEEQGTWYTNIADDTDTTLGITKNLEPYLGNTIDEDSITSDVFTTTTGTPPTIDLNEFSRAMNLAKKKFKADTTGDKYVDALRRMGVDPDWRIQQAPEYLGHRTVEVRPTYSTSSEAATLGQASSKYISKLSHQIRNKSFAEHGYLISMVVFRPTVFNALLGAFEPINDPDDLYQGQESHYSADYAAMGYTSNTNQAEPQSNRFVGGRALRGSNQGVAADYVLSQATGDMEANKYLSYAFPVEATQLGGDFAAMYATCNMRGLIPTPTSIMF